MPGISRLLVALVLALLILGLILLLRPWAAAFVRLVRPGEFQSAARDSDAITANLDKTNLLNLIRAALHEERERMREEEEKRRLFDLLQGRRESRKQLLINVALTVISLVLGWAGSAFIHVPGH